MALEATFRELPFRIDRLRDALFALQITLGDKPPDDESALCDGVENTVLDIMGTLHHARQAASKALKAVGHPMDMDLVRRSLAICQERFHAIEQQFASDLVSYEKLKELARLGSERRKWLPWSKTVKRGIEECRQPLEQISTTLAQCWQELVEHRSKNSISIHAGNVDQKLFTRGSKEAVGDLAG